MARNEARATDEDLDRVWKLIEGIETCMLVTMEAGVHRARPMAPRPRRAENAIYFLTDKTSPKREELEEMPNVCLTFAEGGDYVSVSGDARVLDDRALIGDLWSLGADAFWDGPDDPNICAIEMTPTEAQYWTGPNGLVASVGFLAAVAVGANPDLGENRKVDMN